jgi:hypothetical protein
MSYAECLTTQIRQLIAVVISQPQCRANIRLIPKNLSHPYLHISEIWNKLDRKQMEKDYPLCLGEEDVKHIIGLSTNQESEKKTFKSK